MIFRPSGLLTARRKSRNPVHHGCSELGHGGAREHRAQWQVDAEATVELRDHPLAARESPPSAKKLSCTPTLHPEDPLGQRSSASCRGAT